MTNSTALMIDGQVAHPLTLSYADLAAMPAEAQVADISRFDPKRKGDAVRLDALLARAGANAAADYLTLHAATDDFHASIPLAVVRQRGLVVYRLNGQPLPTSAGGPVRFFIPDHAACHTDEVDDCANVKFVDRIELTIGRGQDTRPTEEEEHAELHRRQAGG